MSLLVRNRQRARSVDTRLLRSIARSLFRDLLHRDEFEIGIFLLGSPAMARLNEAHLRHAGSTDVITFGYADAPMSPDMPSYGDALHGDIFICVEEAVAQARRFKTTWQEEVVRYLVHGALHLVGYDDASASQRREMKRQEARHLGSLREQFRFASLGGHVMAHRQPKRP